MLVLLLRANDVFSTKKGPHKNFIEIPVRGRKSLGNANLTYFQYLEFF